MEANIPAIDDMMEDIPDMDDMDMPDMPDMDDMDDMDKPDMPDKDDMDKPDMPDKEDMGMDVISGTLEEMSEMMEVDFESLPRFRQKQFVTSLANALVDVIMNI